MLFYILSILWEDYYLKLIKPIFRVSGRILMIFKKDKYPF